MTTSIAPTLIHTTWTRCHAACPAEHWSGSYNDRQTQSCSALSAKLPSPASLWLPENHLKYTQVLVCMVHTRGRVYHDFVFKQNVKIQTGRSHKNIFVTSYIQSGEGNGSRMCTRLQSSWTSTPALDRWHHRMDWDEDQRSGYSSGRSWSLERDTTRRQPFLWRMELDDDDDIQENFHSACKCDTCNCAHSNSGRKDYSLLFLPEPQRCRTVNMELMGRWPLCYNEHTISIKHYTCDIPKIISL